ncbi:SAM-dependent methyltransferase [Geobacter sulfurreducens]|uniref:SAM-dependent methyltransferase, putative n=2 Tax=Geobacter sulfurreducens (strain ATCC 51573 / DSM 12127 / PCA) TaxID=243231 RepID=Q74FR2_GEOSL|nr:SAM-dependent methyltransferase [Geobacter sulfurreducens]AAR33875.1 SAM-dependent methyltransferase, putative [Geobacter sulfurreducens PCA]ADI83396.1 SAM-dependent methyltransferase, putative [Geobacter sulfurreducens KN400]AJY70295.1 SAM-dependent methyltransferase [Geobacter sulfurreducens]QVW35799.1 SAM-dependent methyltransferase [Geobacter sulfurreducens]UAC04620.1 SAM-dependent methyltransferase [Geobacter sulfurreducens]
MIPIVDSRIGAYLDGLLPEADPVVAAMEQIARERNIPIVDRQTGRLLYLLARIKQPQLVVVPGDGLGCASWWFARAISISSRVVMIDPDRDNVEHARRMLHDNGLIDRVELQVGDPLGIAAGQRDIDILFMDCDVFNGADVLERMNRCLAKNALLIAVNALRRGSVAESHEDPETAALREFNHHLSRRRDFFTTIVPVGNGVLLGYRLS